MTPLEQQAIEEFEKRIIALRKKAKEFPSQAMRALMPIFEGDNEEIKTFLLKWMRKAREELKQQHQKELEQLYQKEKKLWLSQEKQLKQQHKKDICLTIHKIIDLIENKEEKP